jgi:hypothetical protein
MRDLPTRPPIKISFMLACYVSPEPSRYVLGEWDSEAGIETRRWLQENGLIDENHRATPRGEAWVQFICDTPLPVSKWVMPGGMITDGIESAEKPE